MTTHAAATLKSLKNSDVFATFTEEQLQLFAKICQPEEYAAGEVIFEENSASDDLYVISAGLVEILMNPLFLLPEQAENPVKPLVKIAELESGDVFGEVTFIDEGLRSASARCATAVLLLRLEREPLIALCELNKGVGYQFIYNLAGSMAIKMRNTGLTLREYQLRLMRDKRT